AAEKFYVQGLGLSVLYRSPPQGTHPDQHPEDLIMLGFPGGAWHLELVHAAAEGFPVPAPTEEDLLVLYVQGPVDEGLIERMVKAGGERVVARNEYWERWGVTVQDPDGYRVVLSTRGWENVAVEPVERTQSIATPSTPTATTIAPPSAFVTAAPVGVLVLTPVVLTPVFSPPVPAVVMLPDVPASPAPLVCSAPLGYGVVALEPCSPLVSSSPLIPNPQAPAPEPPESQTLTSRLQHPSPMQIFPLLAARQPIIIRPVHARQARYLRSRTVLRYCEARRDGRGLNYLVVISREARAALRSLVASRSSIAYPSVCRLGELKGWRGGPTTMSQQSSTLASQYPISPSAIRHSITTHNTVSSRPHKSVPSREKRGHGVKVAALILVAKTLLTRALGLAAGAGDESAVAGGVATLESLAGRGGEGEEGGEEKEWRGGDEHCCLTIWLALGVAEGAVTSQHLDTSGYKRGAGRTYHAFTSTPSSVSRIQYGYTATRGRDRDLAA
ncbi:hypothetical protein V495_08365, partial [Pseudogymnoascus sp. VKM F-4514 (FW-929)]